VFTSTDLGYASLVVDYIVDRPSNPFARINGGRRVGDTIEGFTVENHAPRSGCTTRAAP
jgi:hypothetical protein